MLSDGDDGARLGPFLTFCWMQREPDLVPDSQFFEPSVGDRIAMEVDFSTVAGIDEAVIALGDKACDFAMSRNLVCLHVATLAPDLVLELAPHRVETIPDRNRDVLVRMMLGRIALHDDLLPRDLEVDPDVIEIAMTPSFRGLDDDAAAHDAIEEAFQFAGALADFRFDGG